MRTYHIYSQMAPTLIGKDKNNKPIFEANVVYIDSVAAKDSGDAFETARMMGIKYPMIQANNGYDYETGKEL